MISGGLGSGKTCLGVRYCVIGYQNNRKVISNVHLNNIPYMKLDLVDLYVNHPDMKDMFIFGDELYTFMDCRMSGSKRNRLESYFIAQTRKKNCDLYFTTQYTSFIDLRLAHFVDVWVEMKNIWFLDGNVKQKHPYKFIAKYHDYRNPSDVKVKTLLFDGRGFFDHYSTDQVIYPPDDYFDLRVKSDKKNSKKTSAVKD
jgi:hypothetical protein